MQRPLLCMTLLLCSLAALAPAASAGSIDPVLEERLLSAPPMETIRVIVFLRDQVDLPRLEKAMQSAMAPGERIPVALRYRTVLSALQETAERTQPRFMEELDALAGREDVTVHDRFWIRNMVVLSAPPATIRAIASLPGVGTVYLDGLLERDLPIRQSEGVSSPDASEPGLRAINAHRLWERGYSGAGRIVMNIDTGVMGNNLSFNSRWRGTLPGVPASAAWFDPETSTTFPTDGDASSQHGTHTMGIMCGLYAATNDTLGVAPGAYWIAAKTLNSSPHTSRSVAAFQWAANPDGDPGTIDDVPDAISCSWQDPNVASTQCGDAGGYAAAIDAVEALGTAVVFSAGNNGPGAGTLTPPKNRIATAVNIFAVGAVNGNTTGYPIASFSSRGPSTCPGPDSLRFKPEVSAPGVSVRSASGTNGFRTLDGTSMASPHVAGAIALLREAAPYLTGTELKRILMRTAHDLGPAGEDNDYGHGIIDLWAAFQALADPSDPNPPTDVRAYSDFSTPTAMELTWTNPTTLVNGDSIGAFVTRVVRESTLVAEVPDSLSAFVDTGLVDGERYAYVLQTRLVANDSLSPVAQTSWIAGGARTPERPAALTVSGTAATGYTIRWTNPAAQIDGTPLDDLAGIRIYRDGTLLTTLARTAADTARADSTTDSPPGGLHAYYAIAVDDESPVNESAPSNTGFTPLEIPFFDDFPAVGTPNTAIWRSSNVLVDPRGVNPPSPPNALNLNGNPSTNGDTVETLPLDLSGLQGAGLALSYFRQPRGGGENPELADSLIIEMLNDQGAWIQVRRFPGLNAADPVPPFTFDAVGVDGVNPGGGTFFYNGFKFRIRTKGTAGAFDDWFVDDLFFGVPTGDANLAMGSVLSPRGQVSTGSPVTPAVTVNNVSAVTSGAFTVTVEITGPGTQYTGSVADSGLAAGAGRMVTVPDPFTPDAVGLWNVTAVVTLPGDPVASNDTLRATFYAVESLILPLTETFPDSGVPDPLVWTAVNVRVNAEGANEPSEPYSLNLAGNPTGTGLDTVTTLTIDLNGMGGMGVALAYYHQPQGTGDAPETADSLIVEALNDAGLWVTLRKYPGAPNRPFAFEKLDIDSMNAAGGTFFHSAFKFRFRSRAQTGTTAPDDWFVDDVFFGIPSGDPAMVITATRIADTVLVGTVDSVSYAFSILNDNPFGAALQYSVEESPEVPWLTVVPAAGSVLGNGSNLVRVHVDFTGAAVDSYAAQLLVAGNDPANGEDTIAVVFRVNAAPAVAVSPDSFFYAIGVPGVYADSFCVANTGAGPLEYEIVLDPDLAGAERMEITSAGGSSFTGSPRVRGNGFSVTRNVTLTKVEFGLDVPQDNTGLEFFVYESPTQAGTYTKIYSQVTTVNATGGFRLVASDPVRWDLEAGKFYYIGAAWQGATGTEYRYSTVTIAPTWASVLGRYIGPNTAFPGPATLSITSFTAGPYFSAAETGTPFVMTLATPPNGVLAPGDSTMVVFGFSTAGLPVNTYHNGIEVHSNDPIRPVARVAVEVDNLTDVTEAGDGLPREYALFQNYPNPFNPWTTIRYALPAASAVSLRIYNILGQEVVTLVDGVEPAGVRTQQWRGTNGAGAPAGSGVYFYRLDARAADGSGSYTSVRKLLLMK